jgi:hypothetical protein
MNIIEEFGNLSGLKLNKIKTEGIWLGRLKHTKDKYGSPHNLLGAHQAHSAPATSAGGPLKAPRSPGINGVKSCILAISWQRNWPFRN